MRAKFFTAVLICSLLLIIWSCSSPIEKEYEPITISGEVVDYESGNPLINAIVRILNPEFITVTDSIGGFSMTLTIDSTMTLTIVASKEGYISDTTEVLAVPERDIDVPVIELRKKSTGPGETTTKPALIYLKSITTQSISVVESGGIESTQLLFEIQDSAGTPLTLSNAVDVHLSIGAGPGGGESIFPPIARSNVNGQVIATVKSGTKAGVVQVVAAITSPQLASQPVAIVIHAGLPDSAHFAIAPQKLNFPGYNVFGLTDPITAFVGDKYGNVVAAGTAVYFTTTGGTIPGSAYTNQSGQATATLISSNPRPNHSIYGPGYATITAETVDEHNQTIQAEALVLFSGLPLINPGNINPETLDIQNLDAQLYSFQVTDQNANPLASGTNITVTVDGPNLSVTGDANVTLGDYLLSGPSSTDFSFTIIDSNTEPITQPVTITLTTNGPNGEATRIIVIGGASLTGLGPASINLKAISTQELVVLESGGLENAELVFEVQDSAGNPLSAINPVDVEFRIGASPGGGEYLYPETAKTDANGLAKCNLVSGTKSGVVQVIAEVSGTGITSQPVALVIHAGLPDQDHFSVGPAIFNVPGLNIYGLRDKITAIVGDKYGNIVSPGTVVYFSTEGGNIPGSAVTNDMGEASVELISSNPMPVNGYALITAQTADENSLTIEAQTMVLFSGTPIIDATNIDPNTPVANLGGSTFSYTVTDENGNPLAAGTNIKVTIEGQNMQVEGDVDITLKDALHSGPGTTEFNFTVIDGNDTPLTTPVRITVSTDGPNGSAGEIVTFDPTAGSGIGPASIYMKSISIRSITVLECGGIENAEIVFEVQDSAGNPLGYNNTAEVNFAIVAGPNGGEYLYPTHVFTNPNGEATVNLVSGTKAGVVQVLAEIIDPIITSQPVAVTINAGLPDYDHFSVVSDIANLPWYNINFGQTNRIFALVGDKYGNVVKTGTSVYFTTDGAYIQGSALTDELGIAAVDMVAASPMPNHPVLGQGFATVTAQTSDENTNIIEVEATLLFSGYPIITVTPTSINMPNGGSQQFNYTVSDQFGHPMAGGTSITVTVEGGTVEIIGDISITLDDTQGSGPGITEFSFVVYDNDTETDETKPIAIKISVDGPNGKTSRTILGTAAK